MKKAGKLFMTFLAVFCLILPVLPAKADNYDYTITISPGGQGSFADTEGPIVYTKNFGDKVKIDFDGLPEITVKDEKYYPRGLRISGRDDNDNKVIRSETITVHEDVSYTVVYGIKNNRYKYTVRYEDENGKELHKTEEFYGAENDKPVVSFRYIENYLPNAYNETKTITSDESKNVFVFTYTYVGPAETATPTVTPPASPTPTGTPATVTPRPTGTPTTVTPRPSTPTTVTPRPSTPTTVTPRPTGIPTTITPRPTVSPSGTGTPAPPVTSTPAPPVTTTPAPPGTSTPAPSVIPETDEKSGQTPAVDENEPPSSGSDTPGAESLPDETLPGPSASVIEPEELIDLDDDQVPLAGGGKNDPQASSEESETEEENTDTAAVTHKVHPAVIAAVIAAACIVLLLILLRIRRKQ